MITVMIIIIVIIIVTITVITFWLHFYYFYLFTISMAYRCKKRPRMSKNRAFTYAELLNQVVLGCNVHSCRITSL